MSKYRVKYRLIWEGERIVEAANDLDATDLVEEQEMEDLFNEDKCQPADIEITGAEEVK